MKPYRLNQLLARPDFKKNPIRALLRRIIWRIRWSTNQEPWTLPLGNKLLIRVPNNGCGALIYYQGVSEPQTAEFVTRFLRPGMTFIDIGANIGEYSVLAASIIGNSGEVHAFEPQPNIASFLKQNVSINGFSNVVLNCVALSDHEGQADFAIYPDSSMSFLVPNGALSDTMPLRSINVPIMCLDTYWADRKQRIDLIKLDVEGGEFLVLRGAGKTLSLSASEAPVLVFEYAPDNYKRFGYGFGDILRLFHSYGYKVVRYAPRRHVIPIRSKFESSDIINLIATRDVARLQSLL